MNDADAKDATRRAATVPGLLVPFVDAWKALDLEPGSPPSEVKRAYRRLVRAHPPDRDPTTFQRIRAAYELLREPLRAADERLLSDEAYAPLPAGPPPEPGPSPTTLPLTLLRAALCELDVKALDLPEDP